MFIYSKLMTTKSLIKLAERKRGEGAVGGGSWRGGGGEGWGGGGGVGGRGREKI